MCVKARANWSISCRYKSRLETTMTFKAMPFVSKSLALSLLVGLALALRAKRGAYDLPAGVVEQLGLKEVKKTFKCDTDGYYADIDNGCKLFHQCNGGRQSTMACGLNQRFDQSKLTCNHEDASIPCDVSEDFFYLNEKIGDKDATFLSAADMDKAKNARPEYRRARA